MGPGYLETRAGVEVTPGDELVRQAPGLVQGPGLKREYELALVDQAILKREQSEEEMAVGGGSHGVVPIVVGRAGAGAGLRGRPRDQVASGRYRRYAMPLHTRRGLPPDSHVESVGLDDAGTRRRLNKQPDYHHHFDARREAEDSGLPGSTRSSGRA